MEVAVAYFVVLSRNLHGRNINSNNNNNKLSE